MKSRITQRPVNILNKLVMKLEMIRQSDKLVTKDKTILQSREISWRMKLPINCR